MNIIEKMQPARVCVIGDFMLDTYTIGQVKRISPEAPVPVLQVIHERRLPGGAGNTILNLISLGMQVVPVGRVGNDPAGAQFCALLEQEHLSSEWVFKEHDFQTPIKNRMIADNQQIVRVDYEEIKPLSKPLEAQIVSALPTIFNGVRVVAISDYAKGFLTPSLLSEIIQLARKSEIPVIVDPKGIDFKRYSGASIIKPNLSEAIAAARLSPDASLEDIGFKILQDIDVKSLVITRSKEGITLFERSRDQRHFPCAVQEVRDVTGAGDTVLAVITAARANGIDLEYSLSLANHAAGIAIQRIGCARISLAELTERLLKIGYDII